MITKSGKKILLTVLLPATLCFSACYKDLQRPAATSVYTGDTFTSLFMGYWNGMNNNYVYWAIDSTDWDRVYRTYEPLFAKLDLHDSNDVRTSVQYFTQITAGLVDGHYTISFPGAPFI